MCVWRVGWWGGVGWGGGTGSLEAASGMSILMSLLCARQRTAHSGSNSQVRGPPRIAAAHGAAGLPRTVPRRGAGTLGTQPAPGCTRCA